MLERVNTSFRFFYVFFVCGGAYAFRLRVYRGGCAAIIRDVKKIVVIVIVALVAAFILVNVVGESDGVVLRVYADGEWKQVFEAAAYAVEPLDDAEGSEEYIKAACEDALRRCGRKGEVAVEVKGGLVTVTVDGSTKLAAQSRPGGAMFGLERLLGEK